MFPKPWNDLATGAASLVESTPFEALRRGLGRVLGEAEELFGRLAAEPGIRMWEDDDNCCVESELPGFALDGIEIHIRGTQLTLKCVRRPAPRPKDAVVYRRERGPDSIGLAVTLPAPVLPDKAAAKLHNGVLTLTLPKTASSRARRIPVKEAAHK